MIQQHQLHQEKRVWQEWIQAMEMTLQSQLSRRSHQLAGRGADETSGLALEVMIWKATNECRAMRRIIHVEGFAATLESQFLVKLALTMTSTKALMEDNQHL